MPKRTDTARTPALALFERITRNDAQPEHLQIRCTLPDEGERPIVLRLDTSDAATIGYHALRFSKGTDTAPRSGYRTTRAAQLVARHRTTASQLPEPQPPTHGLNATARAAFRRAILAGHTAEEASRIANAIASLQPITSVLSPRTLATLAAVEKGGQR